jgi:folate-dependent phosphoribosylglycinamide formyltransferase PurN
VRVVILAPIKSSLYSMLVAARCAEEPGVEVTGIIVRSILSLRRLRTELRLQGPKTLRKIWEKLVLSGAVKPTSETSWRDLVEQAGLQGTTLTGLARSRSIPLVKVKNLNSPDSVEFLRRCRPDIIAYTGGGLIRKPVLETPTLGVLNAHWGILPDYRGMNVIEWPLLEGRHTEPGCGITVHFMDTGVDTGPIILTRRIPIRSDDTHRALRARFEKPTVEMMIEAIRQARDGVLQARPQSEQEGRQYYVMHPRVLELFRQRLAEVHTAELSDNRIST